MIKVKVELEMVIEDPNGYDEGDIVSCFHGMGQFAETVKKFVQKKLDGDITVDTVAVDGTDY